MKSFKFRGSDKPFPEFSTGHDQIRRISLNNSRGRLFEGGDYFSYCSLEVVPYISCFITPLNQTIITSNKLNMGLLSVPNLVPGLIFRV